jgi:hypothetical protein
MDPLVGLLGPRVEPVLVVEVVREHATRLEVRAHEPVRALKLPLRLRIARLEDHPTNLQLPAEGDELSRGATPRGDRRLAVPHQLLRQRTKPPQIPRQPEQDVRRLLAEDQRPGDRP